LSDISARGSNAVSYLQLQVIILVRKLICEVLVSKSHFVPYFWCRFNWMLENVILLTENSQHV